MKYVKVHNDYKRIHKNDPSAANLKRIIDSDTTVVFGILDDRENLYESVSLGVVAYSDEFSANERTDAMLTVSSNTHFGLNLPAGEFNIVVFADLDKDGYFRNTEVVGKREIVLGEGNESALIVGDYDIRLLDAIEGANYSAIAVPDLSLKKSLYYPAGSIRSLGDPIFDQSMVSLGLFDPASFIEKCPNMFYALEEDSAHKIPVVFVHGIDGSVRAFEPLVEALDETRFKPWFFYYPSGADLNQMGKLFYDILLSGKGVPLSKMPMVIVAHSMGGLVVREALNHYKSGDSENRVEAFVSIASPFGGIRAAATGEKHGLLVLPVWRDLNPEKQFVRGLFRNEYPESLKHHLFYAYENDAFMKFGKNSDGVVSMASQLDKRAQEGAINQFGFESGHVSILEDRDMIEATLEVLGDVKNFYPPEHLEFLDMGGFDVEIDQAYGHRTEHLIRNVGKYVMAIIRGEITPVNPDQEHLRKVINEGANAKNSLEEELLDFWKKNPELR
ncbi:hypothetical protein MLD52_06910 [Puniceicoccaceae bacterium K14]|nr:hypothetical protein [Puniceicoccaceae bacterium K14]